MSQLETPCPLEKYTDIDPHRSTRAATTTIQDYTPELRRYRLLSKIESQRAQRHIRYKNGDPAHIAAAMKEEIGSVPSARLQYAEVVDTATIAPVDKIKPGDSLLVATAVFFGNTRLIDNQFVIAP